MRVATVVHQYPPKYFTGTEQYAHAIGCGLASRGVDVGVFALDPDFRQHTPLWRSRSESVDGLEVDFHSFWAGIDGDWERLDYLNPIMAEKFSAYVRKRQVDVVHIFHLRMLGGGLVDCAREAGARVVVSLMDFWWLCPRIIMMRPSGELCTGPSAAGSSCVECHQPALAEAARSGPEGDAYSRLREADPETSFCANDVQARVWAAQHRAGFLREQLAKVDVLVAPTDYLARVYAENGVSRDRLRVLSYGVDVARKAAPDGTGKRPLVFGFFGTLIGHKGPRVIVDAMESVRGDCRLVIWGRASDFPAYSDPLAEKASNDPRISIRPPFARRDLQRILEEVDVLVVPSLWHENSPFVMLEARSAGVPVIASNFGGLAEVLLDGVEGDLFEPGDVCGLAAVMQRMIDRPDVVASYRSACRPAKSLDTAVAEFHGLYEEILSAPA